MSLPGEGVSLSAPPPAPGGQGLPRVGFLGLGWIGCSRMRALRESGAAEIAVLADPDEGARRDAARDAPEAEVVAKAASLGAEALDGVVIATPSAQHAAQAQAALHAGASVFCEKPLGRDVQETREVLSAARDADRLLAVDLSYRHTGAAGAMREVVRSGQIGEVRFAELVFHNAYGPDKQWFTQRTLAGGGCLIDLGTHLIDLLLWITGAKDLRVDAAAVRRGGARLDPSSDEVEDLALAQLTTSAGTVVRLGCSWFLPAGRDCVFECSLYGSEGAVSMRNLEGSFYAFTTERHTGTGRELLSGPSEDWGGGAITAWARQLAEDRGFDAAADELLPVAAAIERIYEAAE